MMRNLSKLISISARKGQMYYTPEFAKINISTGEYMYILRVCENEGVSQDQLSKLVEFNKSTTAKVLAKLEKDCYVTRVQDQQDKRVYKVYPTESAKEVYPKILNIINDWNRYLVEGLTELEVQTLLQLMEKVEANAIKFEK